MNNINDYARRLTSTAALGILGIVFFMSMMSSSVKAAENRLDWDIGARYEHNNNYRLTNNDDDKESLASYSLRPSADYFHDDGIQQLSLAAELAFSRASISTLDSDDQWVDASYAYNTTRSFAEIKINGSNESTRISELDDTGFIEDVASRRKVLGAQPRYVYLLSEQNSIVADANYRNTDYTSDSYADFSLYGASVGFSRQHSENLKITYSIYYQNYQSEFNSRQPLSLNVGLPMPVVITVNTQVETEYETTGFQAGLDWNFTEAWQYIATIGTANFKTDQAIDYQAFVDQQDYSNEGYTFNNTVKFNGEKNEVAFSLNHNYEDSGNGSVRQNDELKVIEKIRFSERSYISSALAYSKKEAVDGDVISLSNQGREYYYFSASYHYRATESWWLSIAGDYRAQRYSEQDDKAEAFTGSVQVTYRPTAIFW